MLEWQITYGQTSIFLPLEVILDLKLSGREKGQSRIPVSTKDLALDPQYASWLLISSLNKSDCGMRHNYLKNRMHLEEPRYNSWNTFTKENSPNFER